ncbi:MAG: class I SAM-dependent methyltransferase, partial [Planctomycetota bacterium]
MNTKHCVLTKPIVIVLIACTLLVVAARAQDSEWNAKQILDATGIKGGLIIHLGCGDGKLTGAFGKGEEYLVHGLDTSAENVRKAREHVRSLGIYGKVSVDKLEGRRLPYADNLANLVVVEEPGELRMDEIMRVVCPGGAAYIRQKDKSAGYRWVKTVKTVPEEMDEWTHYLYDAGGNAVSKDVAVGPPQHFQWISGPRFSRSHDHLASVSAVVSSDGRLFYIADVGSTAFVAARPDWRLVA